MVVYVLPRKELPDVNLPALMDFYEISRGQVINHLEADVGI